MSDPANSRAPQPNGKRVRALSVLVLLLFSLSTANDNRTSGHNDRDDCTKPHM